MKNAAHNPVYEGMWKTRVDENEMKVTPINLIKIFCEINLENSRFQTQGFDGVKGLLGRTNGLMNLPMIQKCKLFLFNMSGQERLDVICNDFGDDLVDTVTRGNGLNSLKLVGLSDLGIRAIKVVLKPS